MVRIITQNAPAGKPARKRPQTKAQAAAAEAQKEARAAEAVRKLDTRRKVVIGAALLELAKRDPDAAHVLACVKGSLTRPADRKLFEDLANG
ncbi:mobilization protein [Yoonia sp. 67]|uniref:mobilization protein n=1 Tax=Yoonia sp. 67 TaxID=3081449 RepID=UPI002AFFF61D|nr:mobilization protein [Yoonia sp. 67]